MTELHGKMTDVAGTRAPKDSRIRVLTELLERYHDLTDPMQGRDGTGDGAALPLMPATYTPSVRELERLLTVMRQDRHSSLLTLASGERVSVRSLHWHVSERYIRCTHVTRDVPVTRKAKGKRTVTVLERRAIVMHSPQVQPAKVTRGVQWLADNWAATHEPMLPRELLAA